MRDVKIFGELTNTLIQDILKDLSSEYLMDPSDLPLNGVILSVGACRPLVARHVHAHNVQVLW